MKHFCDLYMHSTENVYFIEKLIQKNGLEGTLPMIETLRLRQFRKLTVDQHKRFVSLYINNIKIQYQSYGRVCLEKERLFKIEDISYKKLKTFAVLNLLTTIQLSIVTLVNHIILDIEQKGSHSWTSVFQVNYFLRIVLFPGNVENTRYQYLVDSFQEVLELYLTPKLVSFVEIYCNKHIIIKSLSYERTQNVRPDQTVLKCIEF